MLRSAKRLCALTSFLVALPLHGDPATYTTVPAESEFRLSPLTGQLASGETSLVLLGYSYHFASGAGLSWGPSFFGSVSGSRGGFFGGGIRLGVGTDLNENLRLRWSAEIGAAAGGGVLVGSGAYGRLSAGLLWAFPSSSVGLGVGVLTFPKGFTSVYPFLSFQLPSQWTTSGPTKSQLNSWKSGQWDLALWRSGFLVRQLQTKGKLGKSLSAMPSPTLQLVLRLEKFVTRSSYALVEMHQAASINTPFRGLAAGAGLNWELGTFAIGPVGKIGLAGGGDVPTGQGLYAELGGALSTRFLTGMSLKAEGGLFQALQGEASYPYFSAGVTLDFEGHSRHAEVGRITQELDDDGWSSAWALQLGVNHWASGVFSSASLLGFRLTYLGVPFLNGFVGGGTAAFGGSSGSSTLFVGGGPSVDVGPLTLGAHVRGGAIGGGALGYQGKYFAFGGEGALQLGSSWGLYAGAGRTILTTGSFTNLEFGLKIHFGLPWQMAKRI